MFPPHTDLLKVSELNRLAGAWLPKIAAATGQKRLALLCKLACQLFDAWTEPRAGLCRSLKDVGAFKEELKMTLSIVVMPLLAEIKLQPSERRAIQLAADGRKLHWIGVVTETCAYLPGAATEQIEEEKKPSAADPIAQMRRNLVDDFIALARQQGVTVTRTMIWKRAAYKTRTEFERWERNKRSTAAADRNIGRVLLAPSEFLPGKSKR